MTSPKRGISSGDERNGLLELAGGRIIAANLSLVDEHGCESPKARGISRKTARCAAFSIPDTVFGGSGERAQALLATLRVPQPLTLTRAAAPCESGTAVVQQAQLEHSMPNFPGASSRQSPALSEAIAHERHIRHLGAQMLSHHTAWLSTGCFAARGSADGYRLQMQTAISQRDPAVIELMEVQRGLA